MLNQCIYYFQAKEDTDKSHLGKVIYNAIPKTLLYHCKDSKIGRVLLPGPTRISMVNDVEPSFILVFEINLEQSYLL